MSSLRIKTELKINMMRLFSAWKHITVIQIWLTCLKNT